MFVIRARTARDKVVTVHVRTCFDTEVVRRSGIGTSTAVLVRILVRVMEASGADPKRLLRAHGVDADRLADPEARVPQELMVSMVEWLVDDSGDETIGLKAATLGSWGHVAEYLARNSPTLGVALSRMVEYARLINDLADLELELGDEVASIGGVFPMETMPELPARLRRQGIDGWLAMFVALARDITGADVVPRRVDVSYPRPEDVEPLEAFFRCPIEFGADRSQVVFARSSMDLNVVGADTELGQILEAHCRGLLEELPDTQTTTARVRRALVQALPGGDVSLGGIARALGIGTRTLQRRLAEEEASHQDLLDDVRRELSLRYLREPAMNVTETAMLLGYSDPRAFLRAFKRWSGRTPGEYRREAIGA